MKVFSRAAFDSAINGGVNGGLDQIGVAATSGDFVAHVDLGDTGAAAAGDSAVAVRANAVVKASDLTITMAATGLTTAGEATVTVGSQDNSASIQIGANEGQTTDISVDDMGATALGLQSNGVNVSVMTNQSASATITTVNDALSTVSTQRAKLGAVQNRLEHTIKNLDTSQENLQASESRIRDVDMAKE